MNEKVDIEVFRRKLTVEMEGLTPMEINLLAQRLNEKMTEVSERSVKVADSSKLAILGAMEMSAELYQVKQARQTEQDALEHKVEELTLALQGALDAFKRP